LNLDSLNPTPIPTLPFSRGSRERVKEGKTHHYIIKNINEISWFNPYEYVIFRKFLIERQAEGRRLKAEN
jgi:hypothetical protein